MGIFKHQKSEFKIFKHQTWTNFLGIHEISMGFSQQHLQHGHPTGQHLRRFNMFQPRVLPSGKHTESYGKSPFFIGKSAINIINSRSKLLQDRRLDCSETNEEGN